MKSDACNTDTLEVRLFSVETLQPLYRHIACHPQFSQNRNASAPRGGARLRPSTARSETGRRPDHDPVPPRTPPLPTVHVLPNSRCDLVPVLTPPATAQRAQCCPTCTEVLFTGSLLFTGSPLSHPLSRPIRRMGRNHRPRPRRHPRPRTLLAPWRLRPPQAPTPPPPPNYHPLHRRARRRVAAAAASKRCT